jgi:hypothetical protein
MAAAKKASKRPASDWKPRWGSALAGLILGVLLGTGGTLGYWRWFSKPSWAGWSGQNAYFDYLVKTQNLESSGYWPKALERCLWLYDHGQELGGVGNPNGDNFSGATWIWQPLVKAYPPALEALIKLRADKVASLGASRWPADTFGEIVAMNRVLEDDPKTVALYVELIARDPAHDDDYWRAAKDAILEAKRYDLAKGHMGNFVTDYDVIEGRYLNSLKNLENMRGDKAYFQAQKNDDLVRDTLALADTAVGCGDRSSAMAVLKRAMARVTDRRLEAALAKLQRGKGGPLGA